MALISDAIKLKQAAAAKHKLPGIAVDWMRGESEAEIEEDAARLAKFMGAEDQPKSLDQMTPEEIRTVADKLIQRWAEEWKPK